MSHNARQLSELPGTALFHINIKDEDFKLYNNELFV